MSAVVKFASMLFQDTTSKKKDSTSSVLVGILIAGCCCCVAAVVVQQQHRRTKKEHGKKPFLKRTVSQTSLGLAMGPFPKRCNVPSAIINTACYFLNCPTINDVAQEIVQPLLQYERFSHIMDLKKKTFRPSQHPNYTAQDLVRELSINGDENLTNATIFAHLHDTLIEGRNDLPWWEILILRNIGSGPSVCMIRVHHALADGLALTYAFQRILTSSDGTPLQSLTDALRPLSTKTVGLLDKIWSIWNATVHVITLGFTNFDDDTVFSKHNHSSMKCSGKQDVVIFPDIPLQFIKAIKSSAGTTVNDVLMTAVSQAIHEYCQNMDDPVYKSKGSALQCRVLMPVGLPRPAQVLNNPVEALSNKWCVASCDMAVGSDNVKDRLAQIHSNTTFLKQTPRAMVQLHLQNYLSKYLPYSVSRQILFDVFSRHTLVVTNVPGPNQLCQLAGKTAYKVQLFFANILTQVDLMSYGNTVYGNIVFDPEALPNMQSFGRWYALALVDLAETFDVPVPSDLLALRETTHIAS